MLLIAALLSLTAPASASPVKAARLAPALARPLAAPAFRPTLAVARPALMPRALPVPDRSGLGDSYRRLSRRARAENANRKPGPAAIQKAADFVMENSGGSYWDDNRTKLYPDVNDGNNGAFAYLLHGKAAAAVAEVAQAFHDRFHPPVEIPFDAKAHWLIAVRNSEDETGFYVALMDKATGRIKAYGSEMKLYDLTNQLSDAQRERLFPGSDVYADGFDLLEKYFERGTDLPIGNTERRL